MANTYREAVASYCSGENSINHEGYEHLSTWCPHPVTLTAPRQSCQETNVSVSLIQNQLFPAIGRAVDIVFEIHRNTGGSTVSIVHGSLVGKSLFAVSIFLERTVELHTSPTWQQLFAFAILNTDLLLRPEFAFGTWFDEQRNLHILDVVICIPDFHVALELGRHFSQLSIYDLKRQREIAVSPRISVALS